MTACVAANRVWHFQSAAGCWGQPQTLEKPVNPRRISHCWNGWRSFFWSLKHLHRHILTSAACCRSSRTADVSPALVLQAEQRDPVSRLLWKVPLRRLAAESIQDRLLFSSGELNTALGGPEMYP